MSNTFKIQQAYKVHKRTFPDPLSDQSEWIDYVNEARTCGMRYGDQRKMRAKLKISERKIRRAKEKAQTEKELNYDYQKDD